MRRTPSSVRGYSLIEMLVVLSIVGTLAVAGSYVLGSRRNLGVRALMDDLEGAIMTAHKQAVTTGRDTAIVSQGIWDKTTPLKLTSGEATEASATLLSTATKRASSFILKPDLATQLTAAAVVGNSSWWTDTAAGNSDLLSVEPFKSQTAFSNQLNDSTMNLFQGASVQTVTISGTSKRFNQGFWIKIVGLRNGKPEAGGPMGLLLVQQNGASVFKFYNPGLRSGDKTWRRI